MPRGRSPETWLGSEGAGPIHVELTSLQTRSQVQIGKPGRDCITWMGGAKAIDTVLELAKPGQARLWPWNSFGQRIDERRTELKDDLSDHEVEQEMLALTERFLRITVSKEGRVPLHRQTLDHLDMSANGEDSLYLVYFPTRLELWSRTFRIKMHDDLEQAVAFPTPEED